MSLDSRVDNPPSRDSGLLFRLACFYERDKDFFAAFECLIKAQKCDNRDAMNKIKTEPFATIEARLRLHGNDDEKMMEKLAEYQELQKAIGYQFKKPKFLFLALDRSIDPISREKTNKRLETLGDSMLNAVVIEHLTEVEEFPVRELDAIKQRMVANRDTAMQEICEMIKLPRLLIFDVSERDREVTEDMRADALEALIGAVHRDGEFTQTKQVVLGLWREHIENAVRKKSEEKLQTSPYALQRSVQGYSPYALQRSVPGFSPCVFYRTVPESPFGLTRSLSPSSLTRELDPEYKVLSPVMMRVSRLASPTKVEVKFFSGLKSGSVDYLRKLLNKFPFLARAETPGRRGKTGLVCLIKQLLKPQHKQVATEQHPQKIECLLRAGGDLDQKTRGQTARQLLLQLPGPLRTQIESWDAALKGKHVP